uniref:Citrate transporter-like domain-containing protein n=1 Tax=Brassica oleracea var. oleracea TaxID=109376 RepID=A0A0D3B899_BRAOL
MFGGWLHNSISTSPQVLFKSIDKQIRDTILAKKARKNFTTLMQVGFVTFFLSSILDNLSSTIVMVSLLRKLVPQSEYRKLLGAVVVMAANAGGAWTPIGDVTTTMLWIHGLGVLWVLTDAIHYGESERQKLKIPQALSFTSIE